MAYGSGYGGGYADYTGLVTSLLIETDPDDWYDATDQLISGTVTRGKQNELDQFQAGVATVELDNDDRTWDPTFAASPLAGHILPMKRVKLTASWAGTTYPLFVGYADRWTQNRPGPRRGTTTLQATDALKILARAELAGSVYATEVAVDGPDLWWRLGEPDGSATVADSSGNNYRGTVAGSVTLGESGLVVHDEDGAADFAEAGNTYIGGAGPTLTGTSVWAIEFWIRLNADPAFIQAVAVGTNGGIDWGAGSFYSLQINNVTKLMALIVSNTAGSFFQVNPPDAMVAGTTYHVVVTHAADRVLRAYWNGVLVDTGDTTTGTISINTHYVGSNSGQSAPNAIIDEFAIYNGTIPDATRIAAHNSAGRTPWRGDLPGTRIGRVLDAVGYAGPRDIDDGTTTLQSAELAMSALEHAQKVAETENGDLYVTADGTLRFEERAGAVNQPVAATFSDDPGGELPIVFSNPELSDEHIRNDVTVSRLEGAAQNERDAASIAAYQIASYTLDGLYHDNDDHSRYLAQFILAGYKDPAERVSQMEVNPYRDPDTLWPAVLALELTDRVALNETPQHVAPEVSRTAVIEGITHTFGPKQWAASFNLSENTAATQTYWALGEAGYSELGETTRLYF